MRTDAELLNALERHILRKPIVLWDGKGVCPYRIESGVTGLSLQGNLKLIGLREALEECLPVSESGWRGRGEK